MARKEMEGGLQMVAQKIPEKCPNHYDERANQLLK
jgi:hypothetical protein